MLNIVIQIMALATGLIANFLLPAVYGIQAYGEFIIFNAVVFVLHKTMSIISEPLIHFHKNGQLLYSSLLLNALALALFFAIRAFLPLGSPWLLLGMLLSISVVLTLQALSLKRALVAFTSLVNLLLVGSIVASSQQLLSLSIQQIMEIGTLVPAAVGLLLLARHVGLPSLHQLREVLQHVARRIPHLLSITAVMNLFTNALPLLLMNQLAATQIGQLRVAIAVVQSATGIFPVASQAILAAFVRHKHNATLYPALVRFASFYFAGLGIALVAASYLMPPIRQYLTLVCLLPVFYDCVLTERYLLANDRENALQRINLGIVFPSIAALLVATNLAQVLVLYAVGFAVYNVLLRTALRAISRPWWSYLPVIASPVAVWLAAQWPWAGVGYLAGLLFIELLHGKPTRDDIRMLRNAL